MKLCVAALLGVASARLTARSTAHYDSSSSNSFESLSADSFAANSSTSSSSSFGDTDHDHGAETHCEDTQIAAQSDSPAHDPATDAPMQPGVPIVTPHWVAVPGQVFPDGSFVPTVLHMHNNNSNGNNGSATAGAQPTSFSSPHFAHAGSYVEDDYAAIAGNPLDSSHGPDEAHVNYVGSSVHYSGDESNASFTVTEVD